MDEEIIELQELLADPIMEEELPPHLVAEFRFTRFQTPRLHTGLVRFHQKMDTRIFKSWGTAPEFMEGNFQARGLTNLEGLELCRMNRMVYLFRIWPYEIQVRSLHLTNSFMYRNETITAAYEGAGWVLSHWDLSHTSSLCLSSRFWNHSSCTLSSYSCFRLNFWNLPWSLTGYLLWMLWLMNGILSRMGFWNK